MGTSQISIATSNEHPVDELAHVQEKIAILKLREKELKDLILQGSCGLIGDRYQASVTTSLSRQIDVSLLRAVFRDEELALFSRPAQAIYVKTSRKHGTAPKRETSKSFAWAPSAEAGHMTGQRKPLAPPPAVPVA